MSMNFDQFREKVNKRITDRLNRPTLTEGLQQQNERRVNRKYSWSVEFRSDPATYIIMMISALFTSMLGLIMGLAPTLQTNPDGSSVIMFNTDLMHWVIAVLYVAAFVTVTEAAFLIGKHKFHIREEGNVVQLGTMLFMMILAGVSIVGTGYAGGAVTASVLGFLSDFQEIPHNAQGWVVKIIPTLLALYAFLLTAYRLSSMEEKNKRLTEQMKRQQENDHKLQMDMVELESQEILQLAEIKAYQEAVEKGYLSAAEANAARRAGKTLGQLESEIGRDLNGDKHIGPVQHRWDEDNGMDIPALVGFSGNGKSKPGNP